MDVSHIKVSLSLSVLPSFPLSKSINIFSDEDLKKKLKK